MKNSIITTLILLTVVSVNAQKNYFGRLTEMAHPTPRLEAKAPYYMLQSEEELPILFRNSNLIVPETGNKQMQNESSIAVNPLNPLNLIASAVDYRGNSSSWVYVSQDGGKTWENYELGKPEYAPDWRCSNDPSVAYDYLGTAYMVCGGFPEADINGNSTGENGVFLHRSFNDGKNWEKHIPIIFHEGVMTPDSAFDDKYYIMADNSVDSPYRGHLYIPWKRVTAKDSATQIMLTKSEDQGLHWSEPVPVSSRLAASSEDTTFGQSFPLAMTGPQGQVYVVWNHGIEHGIGFARSNDGGKTFTDPRIIRRYNIFGTTMDISTTAEPMYRHTVKGKVRAESYPVIVCDTTDGPRRGYLYLCWAADTEPNIYFSFSENEGDDWSDPVIVHSVTDNDQFWPWLSFDPETGDLAIMYLDSRNDEDNMMVECFVSYSSDGGKTWIDRRAADISSDIRRNPFNGHFAGDYSGAAFYRGKVYPSWVDMRNAVENLYDSDVFTSIINTRAPEPVSDLKIKILPEKNDQLELNWKNPEEKAFGQPIGKSELGITILRDGEPVATLTSGETSYTDEGLSAYQLYHYSVLAYCGTDTSMAIIDSSWAGGSRQPGLALVSDYWRNSSDGQNIFVKIPGFRADNFTPLVNIASLEVYRDGEFLESVALSQSDTGSVIVYYDEKAGHGYYEYTFMIADDNEPANLSVASEPVVVYSGPLAQSLSDGFESMETKYYNKGAWALVSDFFHAGEHCLTESPDGNYESNKIYEFRLFPLAIGDNHFLKISFWHAALIHRGDKASLQISKDFGRSWTDIAVYNNRLYDPWRDKNRDIDDWKSELMSLEVEPGDTVMLRFYMETSIGINEDGWYIDELNMSAEPVSVDEEINNDVPVLYPNPASDFVCIHNVSGIRDIRIYNNMGALQSYAPDASGGRINVALLAPGIYYISFTDYKGMVHKRKFAVIK